jgi:hypothetical protein
MRAYTKTCAHTLYAHKNVHTLQVPISTQDLVLMSYEQLRRELAGKDCPLLK